MLIPRIELVDAIQTRQSRREITAALRLIEDGQEVFARCYTEPLGVGEPVAGLADRFGRRMAVDVESFKAQNDFRRDEALAAVLRALEQRLIDAAETD